MSILIQDFREKFKILFGIGVNPNPNPKFNVSSRQKTWITQYTYKLPMLINKIGVDQKLA